MSSTEESQPTIWSNKVFVKIFGSYSISMMGQYFDMVAIMILFGYVWKVEPIIIAMIPVMYALPHALLSQFAGIIADRLKKVKLMRVADLLTAGLTLLLLLAPNPWWALPILFLRSIVTVIHFPVQQALIKHIVHESLILKAVTLNGTVNQFSKVIGPFLGASLAASFSPQLCILINAIAFIISALILFTISKNVEVSESIVEEASNKENLSFWGAWQEGWSIIFKNRILLASFSFSLIGFISIQLVDVQFPVLFREIAPGRPELVGWVMSASGLGALCVIILLNRLKELKHHGMMLGGGILFIGCGFTCMGLFTIQTQTIYHILAGVIIGVGVGLFIVVFNYMLQKESPKEAIGRVSGIYNSLASLILILAPVTGGFLVQAMGPSLVYKSVGMIIGMIGLIGILLQRVIWGNAVANNEEIHVLQSERGMVDCEKSS